MVRRAVVPRCGVWIDKLTVEQIVGERRDNMNRVWRRLQIVTSTARAVSTARLGNIMASKDRHCYEVSFCQMIRGESSTDGLNAKRL